MLRRKKTDSEGGGGTIIVVIFGICVCCVIMSILGAIAAYYFSIKKEAPFDKKLLEYRDKEGAHIIKSLPFDVKNAYYLNMPVGTQRYTFTGKACLDDVCDDVNLKNVEAINLYYDDAGLFSKGTLLSGTLSYKT